MFSMERKRRRSRKVGHFEFLKGPPSGAFFLYRKPFEKQMSPLTGEECQSQNGTLFSALPFILCFYGFRKFFTLPNFLVFEWTPGPFEIGKQIRANNSDLKSSKHFNTSKNGKERHCFERQFARVGKK